MSGFTPGPWRTFDHAGIIGVTPVARGVGDVAHLNGLDPDRPHAVTAANARLIAAAPALVEALTHAVEIAEAKRDGNWDDLLKYRSLLKAAGVEL